MSPRVLPPEQIASLKRRGGDGPIALLDIVTADGSEYFWSDHEGKFPTGDRTAYRVQTSGGGAWLKFLNYGVPSQNGVGECLWGNIRNNGPTRLEIANNLGGTLVVAAYGWVDGLLLYSNGNGASGFQYLVYSADGANKDLDFTIGEAKLSHWSAGANLIDPNIAGGQWTGYSGSVATITADQPRYKQYSPWLKQAGPIRRSRDMRTDAGDIVVQNLSGNTVDRDVALLITQHEFEGALAILRFWDPFSETVTDEFHGYLSEQNPGEEEVVFRLLQLFDVAQFEVADEPYSETCTLRFKSAQCGSASANTTCSKKFADCTAQERFNGCPTPPPQTTAASHLNEGGTGTSGGGTGGGGGIPHRPDMVSPL